MEQHWKYMKLSDKNVIPVHTSNTHFQYNSYKTLFFKKSRQILAQSFPDASVE